MAPLQLMFTTNTKRNLCTEHHLHVESTFHDELGFTERFLDVVRNDLPLAT